MKVGAPSAGECTPSVTLRWFAIVYLIAAALVAALSRAPGLSTLALGALVLLIVISRRGAKP